MPHVAERRLVGHRGTPRPRIVRATLIVLLGLAAVLPGSAAAKPVASITASPSVAEVGQLINLTVRATTDPSASVQEYDWDYGDGNVCNNCAPSNTYDYSATGVYTITVTVVDTSFNSTTATTTVRITADPQETARSGSVLADLFYTVSHDRYGDVVVNHEHVRITDGSTVVADRSVSVRGGSYGCAASCAPIPFGYSTGTASLHIRDLDDDGQPEILLDLTNGGNICCRYTIVFSRTNSGTYRGTLITWIDQGAIPPLRDLHNDRRLEFLSSDGRFRYRFGCGGCTPYPIQIWAFRGGRFHDVTRNFPSWVRGDARLMYRLFRQAVRSGSSLKDSVRGALAAYVADECSLGRAGAGWRLFDAAARAGDLTDPPTVASAFRYPPSRFRRDLKRFLRQLHYLP
jgi:PKD repeat protein